MKNCPLSLRIAASLTGIVSGALLISPAFAYDASLPFRSYPGFVCHAWNARGECSDYSYIDYRNAADPDYRNVYVAPTYRQPVRYAQPVIRQPWSATVNGNMYGYRYACTPTTDCTGEVTVRVSSSPTTVAPRGLITYNVYLRNNDSQTRTVDLRAYLDSDTVFESATFGGYSDGKNVRWNTMQMPPMSSRTVQVNAYVRGNIPVGRTLAFQAHAGSSLDSMTTRVLASGFGSNAIEYREDGIYGPVGYPPVYRRLGEVQPPNYGYRLTPRGTVYGTENTWYNGRTSTDVYGMYPCREGINCY